jgi:hypothetical protein
MATTTGTHVGLTRPLHPFLALLHDASITRHGWTSSVPALHLSTKPALALESKPPRAHLLPFRRRRRDFEPDNTWPARGGSSLNLDASLVLRIRYDRYSMPRPDRGQRISREGMTLLVSRRWWKKRRRDRSAGEFARQMILDSFKPKFAGPFERSRSRSSRAGRR